MKQILFLISLCFVGLGAHAQTEPRLVLPIGHTGHINSAVFSPDGKYALTASGDHTARIYEVSSGKELQVLSGHTGSVYSSVFSPDGRKILTASNDGTAIIWDVETGDSIHVFLKNDRGLSKAFFSPNFEQIVTLSYDGSACIYDPISYLKKYCLYVNKSGARRLEYSSDFKQILTVPEFGTDVLLWELSNGRLLDSLKGEENFVNGAHFFRNNKLVFASYGDGSVRIFDTETSKVLQDFIAHKDYIHSTAICNDSKYAVTLSGDSTACLWDLSTLEISRTIRNQNSMFHSAAFSSDGELFSIAGDDGSISIRESNTGNEVKSFIIENVSVLSATFNSNSKSLLVICSDNSVRIINLVSGIEEVNISGQTIVDLNGNGFLEAKEDLADHTIEQDVDAEWNYWERLRPEARIEFSDDSSLVVLVSNDIIELWISRTHEMLLEPFIYDEIVHVTFSSDNNFLAATTWDGQLVIWSVHSGAIVRNFRPRIDGKKEALYKPNFSLGSKHVVCHGGDFVYILDLFSGEQICSFNLRSNLREKFFDTGTDYLIFDKEGSRLLILASANFFRSDSTSIFISDSLFSLNFQEIRLPRVSGLPVFNSSGELILTGHFDGVTRLWDSYSGRLLQLFKGHIGRIDFVQFSADSKHILTTGADHKTILWDATTGKPLYTRLQLKNNDWLIYDEHYRFDGTPGAIEKLYFVCGLEPIDLAQMKDSLWVPGLAEKIINKQDILINDKPAPKLSELNICELTPVIEPIEQDDKRMLKYRITPRRGALGDTELYINGNLTYTYKPEKLEKKKEGSTTVYYLTIDSDTLQGYLAGKQYAANPVLIKSKVKGTGIYGRGEQCTIAKKSSKDDPHFYGVFIGVNDYGNERKEPNEQHYKNLDFAVKDAQDLSVAVEQTARNLFKDNCHIYRLAGEGNTPATKDNLQKVLAEIGGKSTASDVLYIFFAGHGDVRRMKDTIDQVVVEQDQIRFMMQRADKRNPLTTSFGVRELSEWCSPRNIKAQKRVFVFDACHSGKITQEAAGGFRGDDEGTRIRQLDKLKDKNGMMILAAAADDESAYEDETLNQGVLTYHLLQVMKEEAKDTSLVVRDWFDETIDLVKEYSRLNGNKQEPSSFGDGRFEIGNVSDNVRNSIKITCPKTRVGACVFVDPTGEAEALFPNVASKVNAYFSSTAGRGNLVYSQKSDKSYRPTGTYFLNEGKLLVRYKITLGEQQAGQSITLPSRKYNNEDELVQAIVTSISQEIEALSMQDERCKLMNK